MFWLNDAAFSAFWRPRPSPPHPSFVPYPTPITPTSLAPPLPCPPPLFRLPSPMRPPLLLELARGFSPVTRCMKVVALKVSSLASRSRESSVVLPIRWRPTSISFILSFGLALVRARERRREREGGREGGRGGGREGGRYSIDGREGGKEKERGREEGNIMDDHSSLLMPIHHPALPPLCQPSSSTRPPEPRP